VYGPQGVLEKKMFIRELKGLKDGAPPAWLLMGDFNLISSTRDKNNGRVNMAMINRFKKAVNHMQVRELNLLGKKFTWSNQQATPTLTRIDKMFCTPGWENLYDKPALQALSSSTSDHCPLLVSSFSPPRSRPKLDISQVFDTVNWSYLLYVIEHLGFTQKWRNWISSLWCTSSSILLVNDIPCKNIFHCRGVRQEDPPLSLSCSFFWQWSHCIDCSEKPRM
jgi:hypothetical protein